MTRRRALGAAAAAAVALALGACPISQPVPGVSPIDGGTITPPRIQVDGISLSATVVFYDPACPDPQFTLGGTVVDQNVEEVVSVRWFVNYDPSTQSGSRLWTSENLPVPLDPTQTQRPLTAQVFRPLDWPGFGSSEVRVVEVVVSNGFAPASPDGGPPPPNRAPLPGFETQYFRWVFHPAAGASCGN